MPIYRRQSHAFVLLQPPVFPKGSFLLHCCPPSPWLHLQSSFLLAALGPQPTAGQVTPKQPLYRALVEKGHWPCPACHPMLLPLSFPSVAIAYLLPPLPLFFFSLPTSLFMYSLLFLPFQAFSGVCRTVFSLALVSNWHGGPWYTDTGK